MQERIVLTVAAMSFRLISSGDGRGDLWTKSKAAGNPAASEVFMKRLATPRRGASR
jgi:hypothetical protein